MSVGDELGTGHGPVHPGGIVSGGGGGWPGGVVREGGGGLRNAFGIGAGRWG